MSDERKSRHGGWLVFILILAAAYYLNSNPQITSALYERITATELYRTIAGTEEEESVSIEDVSPEILTGEVVDSTLVSNGYAYATLTESGQKIYDEVYSAMMNFSEDAEISTTDPNELKLIYNCVSADHPEIFWVSGYSYTTYSTLGVTSRMTITPQFDMTKSEAESYTKQVEEIADSWLSGISMDASDYEKSKYVFETIINNTEYVTGSDYNQTILSVFLNGQSVCQGYAEATAYLLHKLGITSAIIPGEIPEQGGHAFNLVLLDGQWYYMDTTWGDGSYLLSSEDESTRGRTNYLYLNTTTEELGKTHTFTATFQLPECTSNENNYYVHEGRYFTAYNKEVVGNVLRTAYENGEEEISIRFENAEAYEQAKVSLLDESGLFDYIPVNKLSALKDENNMVITLVLGA